MSFEAYRKVVRMGVQEFLTLPPIPRMILFHICVLSQTQRHCSGFCFCFPKPSENDLQICNREVVKDKEVFPKHQDRCLNREIHMDDHILIVRPPVDFSSCPNNLFYCKRRFYCHASLLPFTLEPLLACPCSMAVMFSGEQTSQVVDRALRLGLLQVFS